MIIVVILERKTGVFVTPPKKNHRTAVRGNTISLSCIGQGHCRIIVQPETAQIGEA